MKNGKNVIAQNGRLVVSSPNIKIEGGKAKVFVQLENLGDLWFSVPDRYANFLSPRADALAVALLPVAMLNGRDLHLNGAVTDTLLFTLNGEIQDLLRVVYSDWHKVSVTAPIAPEIMNRGNEVATGYSAGVDSLSAIQTFLFANNLPDSLRITHLLHNNVGSFRAPGREGWVARTAVLRKQAEIFGIPLIDVDSNLQDFYPAELGFVHIHSLCNAAVAHLLSARIGTLHYSSAYDYAQVLKPEKKKRKLDIGHLDLSLLPLISTTALHIRSADSNKNRTVKTLEVAQSPYKQFLDVCTSSDPGRSQNCSRCIKCVRTLMTLEIAGEIEAFFPQPFSREPYKKQRILYMAITLGAKDDLSRELIRFARSRKYRWPLAARLLSVASPFFVALQNLRKRQRLKRAPQ